MKTNKMWGAYVRSNFDGGFKAVAWKQTGRGIGDESNISSQACDSKAKARRVLTKLAREFGIELEWEK